MTVSGPARPCHADMALDCAAPPPPRTCQTLLPPALFPSLLRAAAVKNFLPLAFATALVWALVWPDPGAYLVGIKVAGNIRIAQVRGGPGGARWGLQAGSIKGTGGRGKGEGRGNSTVQGLSGQGEQACASRALQTTTTRVFPYGPTPSMPVAHP